MSIYVGMSLIKVRSFPYANGLACCSETSQAAGKIAHIRVWISAFEDTKDDSTPTADLEYM